MTMTYQQRQQQRHAQWPQVATAKLATAFEIAIDIENDGHADMIALQDRARFLVGLAHDQNILGKDELLALMYQGLHDWNRDNSDFYIHKGGHHVAVCKSCGSSIRYMIITVGF
jgi:hypothetical protein